MKIVTDQISRLSTSVNNMDAECILKPDIMTAGDHLRGDLNMFSEDLSSSICHIKDVDPLQLEMEDYIMELQGNGGSIVKESQTEVCFDDSIEARPSKIRADMDGPVQLSAVVNGMEFENLYSQGCSRETDGSAVRDICIDEGVPATANDNICVADVQDGHKYSDEDSNSVKDTIYGSDKVKREVEWPLPVGLESMTDEVIENDINSCKAKVLVHQTELESETAGLVSSDCQEDRVDTVVAEDIYAEKRLLEISMENRGTDKQNNLSQESVAKFEDSNGEVICSSTTLETSAKVTADNTTSESSYMKIDSGYEAKNNPTLPTAVKMVDTYQMPLQENLPSDHFTTSARIQRDHFESSFASVGHYTNSAYSGSISHRSDASTVSTRSFAFPVLQNEWNFSPVRMRKADRQHLGRRRGWMNGLFCCKF